MSLLTAIRDLVSAAARRDDELLVDARRMPTCLHDGDLECDDHYFARIADRWWPNWSPSSG